MKLYKGITYARYSRFQESIEEPFTPGVSEFVDEGCLCPQSESRLSHLMSSKGKSLTMAEGRLSLSIYVPDGEQQKLPVMVWIHGGAYMSGGSEDPRYSADRLVESGNLIVVRISYRLGALGYLWLPERGISNLGLKDQQTALRWIRRNIEHFGGDSNNITIFGQSAGAHSIAALIALSEEELLFNKAILQSPPLGISITPEEAHKISIAFIKKLGKDLFEASVEEILAAQKAVAGMKMGMTFMPVLEDNTRCPNLLAQKNVRILSGCNAQDSSIFLRAAMGRVGYFLMAWMLERMFTRRIFTKANDRYISRLSQSGVAAQSYNISWHPKGNALKSCHCIELPFLFGTLKDWIAAEMLQGMSKEEFERNSAVMLKLWTEFARSGEFPQTENILPY